MEGRKIVRSVDLGGESWFGIVSLRNLGGVGLESEATCRSVKMISQVPDVFWLFLVVCFWLKPGTERVMQKPVEKNA